jgi:ribosome recycling factor
MKELLRETRERMKKSVEATRVELASIRTGRASASLLDTVTVECYGTTMHINQVANVATPEPRLITITPWDKANIEAIEKAILKSDLGLTPSTHGNLIRLPIPQLNEERRKSLVKVVKKLGEEGRVAIRNVRRDANEEIKKREKAHEISEDDSHRNHGEVQKLTDKYIERVEELIKKKEEEILEV